MHRRWVLPLLIASGFAGLAYELLWVRLLALGFGATTASFSVVLAVFFGGLAAGSRWAGRRSMTTTRPLATYAALEGVTGLLGLLLYPALKHTGALIAAIDPGAGAAGVVVRLVIAAAFLLPPTFLMGATLPFVSAGTIARDESTGPGIALIYAFNTAGACLGAFTVTFLLLPQLGVFRATLVTAGLNLVVAAVAFVMSRRGDGQASAQPQATDGAPAPSLLREPSPKVAFAALVAALVGGLVATSAQVVWGRLFAIQLRGTTFGIGSVLVAVLLGIAGGSLVSALAIRRSQQRALTAAVFVALTLLGLFLFVAAVPLMTWALSTVPSFGASPMGQYLLELLLVVIFLALPCGASGALLPTLVAVLEQSAGRAGQTLAKLYAANTLGCIVGSILTGFVLLPTLGSPTTMYLLYLTLTLVLVVFLVSTSLTQARLATLGLIVLGLAGAAYFPQLDLRFATQLRPTMSDLGSFLRGVQDGKSAIVSTYEGDVATATVTKLGEGRALQLNGLGQGSWVPTPPSIPFESVLVATVPWVHASAQHRALVVGLGAGGTVATLAGLGVERVDVAELEDGVVSAVGDIWGAASPLLNPRVQLIRNDARHHLLTMGRREPASYDLITSMPAHPWIAAALFTEEFFALAKSNLTAEGVFSTWFGIDHMSDETVKGLVGAFAAVFPHWVIYWVPETNSLFLVGSQAPMAFDVQRASTLVGHPALPGFPRRLLEPTFLSSRIASANDPARPFTAEVTSTDDNGLVEFSSQQKRNTSVAEALASLPLQSMPPRLVKGADREQFVLRTFEQGIGAPFGWLPLPTTDASKIRRASSAMDDSLSPALRAYARVRAQVAEGHRDEATASLGTIDEPGLAERARKVLAASEAPGKRLEALKALRQDADVRATIVSLGGQDEATPLDRPGLGDDPLGWLFVEPTQLSAASDADRTQAITALLERLALFASQALYERCDRQLSAGGWTDAAALCREAAVDARRREAGRLVKEAFEQGGRARYPEAIASLLKAHALVPLQEANARVLLQAATKLNDERTRRLARELLLARGVSPDTIRSLEARAAQAEPQAPLTPPEEP